MALGARCRRRRSWARSTAVLALVAVPVLLLGDGGAVRQPAEPWAVPRRRERSPAAVRDLHRRLLVRDVPGALLLIPLDRDAPHVPGGSRYARDGGRGRRRSWRFLAVGVADRGADGVPTGGDPGAGVGARVIFSTETPVCTRAWSSSPRRATGSSSTRASGGALRVSPLGGYLSGGYWDDFLVFRSRAPAPRARIAILGDAGGTLARAYGHYFRRPARWTRSRSTAS